MFVIFPKFPDNLLISLKLPAHMLHRVQYKNTIRDILVFVSCEPIWEDCVRGTRVRFREFCHLDAWTLQSQLEIIKFTLCLKNFIILTPVFYYCITGYFTYYFIGIINFKTRLLHELIVYLAVFILIKHLWTDDNNFIGEDRPRTFPLPSFARRSCWCLSTECLRNVSVYIMGFVLNDFLILLLLLHYLSLWFF